MFFMLLLFFQVVNCQESVVEIEFIKNYVQINNESTVVNALLCWNFDEIILLIKELKNLNIMINVGTRKSDFNDDYLFEAKILYIIDLNCNFEPFLNRVNNTNTLNMRNQFLIIKSNNLSTNLQKYNFYVDTKVVIATKLNDESFQLKFIYKFDLISELIEDHFCDWQMNEGFIFYDRKEHWERRRNLKRHVLVAGMAVMYNSTYEHFFDYRDNEKDPATKVNYMLTLHLMDFLNASLKISFFSSWYNVKTSDQNNTLIGSLIMKQIDISSTPFFCKKERLHIYKCLAMTTPVNGFFMFRKPPLSYVKNIFALPFEATLWLTDIFVLLTCSVLLYLIVAWEWKKIKENDVTVDGDLIENRFSDAILFTIGAVCQQGYDKEPKGNSGKILMLTIFITLIFLFTAYTAYTVVLFQSTADNIKTLEDLYNSKMTLGSDDKPYFKNLFKSYTDKWSKKIYEERLAPKGVVTNFFDIRIGLSRIRNEFFAFQIDQMTGYNTISSTFYEQEKCGLEQIKYLQETDPYIVSPVDNKFLKLFKIGLLWIQELGISFREYQKRVPKKPECLLNNNNYRSVGILDLYSLYILLIIGYGISLIILFIEVLTNRFQPIKRLR